jgi:hypothetical protein
MKKIKLPIIIFFVFVFQQIYAQPGPGAGAPCWPPPCVPIDGGISIFVAIAAFAGYKLSSKSKN